MKSFKKIESNVSNLIALKETEEITFDRDLFGQANLPVLFRSYFGQEVFKFECHALEVGTNHLHFSGSSQVKGSLQSGDIFIFNMEEEVKYVIAMGKRTVSNLSKKEWDRFFDRFAFPLAPVQTKPKLSESA